MIMRKLARLLTVVLAAVVACGQLQAAQADVMTSYSHALQEQLVHQALAKDLGVQGGLEAVDSLSHSGGTATVWRHDSGAYAATFARADKLFVATLGEDDAGQLAWSGRLHREGDPLVAERRSGPYELAAEPTTCDAVAGGIGILNIFLPSSVAYPLSLAGFFVLAVCDPGYVPPALVANVDSVTCSDSSNVCTTNARLYNFSQTTNRTSVRFASAIFRYHSATRNLLYSVSNSAGASFVGTDRTVILAPALTYRQSDTFRSSYGGCASSVEAEWSFDVRDNSFGKDLEVRTSLTSPTSVC